MPARLDGYDYSENNFSPAIPAIIKKIKNILINSLDSPKSIIPKIAVPTAPMPVHIGYAVPSGSVLTETESKYILNTRATIVNALGQNFVNPSEYFKPTAQAISNKPAMSKMIQFIIQLFILNQRNWIL
jgi:hypothetical protein